MKIKSILALFTSVGTLVGCGEIVGKGTRVTTTRIEVDPVIDYSTTELRCTTSALTLRNSSITACTTSTVVNTSFSEAQEELNEELLVSSENQNSEVFYLSDYERELLAEVVEYEAGADWLTCYERACCVAVIMNRVNQGCWGGSDIYSVLTYPNQFSNFYPGYCTPREGAYEAVDYYFAHPNEFSSEITGWYGDGYQNYFT